MTDFYRHLEERFQKRAPKKLFQAVLGQIPDGARPHHNFHVFAMSIRTGHVEVAHTVHTMDECRISWGTVTAVMEDELLVERRPLIMRGDELILGDSEIRAVRWRFNGKIVCSAGLGDVVAIHWGCVCDCLTVPQLARLRRETRHHRALANRKHRIAMLA